MKILQTLDIHNNCKGLFYKDRFYYNNLKSLASEFDVAWKHSPLLSEDENYRFLYLSIKEEDLSSYCHDPELFMSYKRKVEAQKKAALTCEEWNASILINWF